VKKTKGRVGATLLLAAVAALMLFTLGGAPAGAQELHPLTVTATTSITCDWAIQKSGPSHVTLAVNQEYDIPYTVDVVKTCTNHVRGTVDGDGNPDSVDVTAGGAAATVDCKSDLVAGTFHCTYDARPASTADGTAQATAHYAGGATATGSAPYSFTGVSPTEDSVDVLDSNLSSPLAIHLDHSQTFHYTVHVVFHDCGHFSLDNTATVRDGVVLGTSTVTVVVDVPCGSGCTLTQGYWKTHSKYGPAPSDPAWNNVTPSGPDTAFFSSGQTWLQVFKTAPAGNAYYILAVQFMAAKLNILNGASSTPAVNAALAWATTFFSTYTPAQAGALAKNSSTRAAAISNASTLESYNSGGTGPGHCNE